MLEQELKDIWNNSSQTETISIETDLLIQELNSEVNAIQKTIRRRDIREISASVLGIIMYSFLLYEIPFPISKLACSLSISWFIFVILKFQKSKRQNIPTNLSLSLTEQLAQQNTLMQQQKNLLNSSVYWYSLLSFVINFIFIIGLENPLDYNWTNTLATTFLPLSFSFKIIMIIGLAFIYSFIIWINKRVINKSIKPLIQNIEIIQQQLKTE